MKVSPSLSPASLFRNNQCQKFDCVVMMSIWGWVGKEGSGRGWNQLSLCFVVYVFFNM